MRIRRAAVPAVMATALAVPILAASAASATPVTKSTVASRPCDRPGPWGIHATAVNLRSKPTTSSKAVGVLYKSHKFKVHSTSGNWVNLTDTTTGIRGWASQTYVYRDVYMCLD
ncbi:SH3 domain-containing protein [Streptomyces goshikiensis]|uniref:SH3 domain-containing protein n=1 Tax=Streptomyces goshikiensis TaxID=1942 RepID=UPI00368CD3BD